MDSRDPSERVAMETTTAHETYRAARERLDERLNMINRLVRAHDAREFRDRSNWGHAGSIEHLNEVLDEAIAFLGGTKETTT